MAINPESIARVIDDVLTEYSDEVAEKVKKETSDSMKKLVKLTRETAPVGNRTQHYRDSITSKTLSETPKNLTKVWYAKGSDYRLSHLLNNGHQTRNGGRVEGTKFITQAAETVLEEYEKSVERACEHG